MPPDAFELSSSRTCSREVACTGVSGSGAHCSSAGGPDRRPHGGPGQGRIVRRLIWGGADLLRGPLAADGVIDLKLIKPFAASRQDQDVWAGRQRRASDQQEHR